MNICRFFLTFRFSNNFITIHNTDIVSKANNISSVDKGLHFWMLLLFVLCLFALLENIGTVSVFVYYSLTPFGSQKPTPLQFAVKKPAAAQ